MTCQTWLLIGRFFLPIFGFLPLDLTYFTQFPSVTPQLFHASQYCPAIADCFDAQSRSFEIQCYLPIRILASQVLVLLDR